MVASNNLHAEEVTVQHVSYVEVLGVKCAFYNKRIIPSLLTDCEGVACTAQELPAIKLRWDAGLLQLHLYVC